MINDSGLWVYDLIPPYCPICGLESEMKLSTLWSSMVSKIARVVSPPKFINLNEEKYISVDSINNLPNESTT